MLDNITPVVLTLNEMPNIARTLSAVQWAMEVVVVDSDSTDGTAQAARAFSNVRFWTRPFDTHASQWNAAVRDPQIKTEWVLALDADYLVTPSLVSEMAALRPTESVSGYRVRFQFAIDGIVLRGSLYPPHVVLFRRARGEYVQDGHTQRLVLAGPVADLATPIIHDDRKPMSRWVSSQRGYARQEAARLRSLSWAEASQRDRVRKMLIVAPWAVPAYVLFVQGVLLDGWSGLRYAWQRSLAEVFIAKALVRSHLELRKPD